MTTTIAKRVVVAKRRSERERKRRLRASMAEEHVPSRAAIERALVQSLRHVIVAKYGAPLSVPPTSDLQAVVRQATGLLTTAGYRLKSPRARALFARALGETASTSPVTPPVGN